MKPMDVSRMRVEDEENGVPFQRTSSTRPNERRPHTFFEISVKRKFAVLLPSEQKGTSCTLEGAPTSVPQVRDTDESVLFVRPCTQGGHPVVWKTVSGGVKTRPRAEGLPVGLTTFCVPTHQVLDTVLLSHAD